MAPPEEDAIEEDCIIVVVELYCHAVRLDSIPSRPSTWRKARTCCDRPTLRSEVEEKNIPARPLVFLKRRKRKREERFVQTKTDASINFSATNFKEQIDVDDGTRLLYHLTASISQAKVHLISSIH